MSFESCLRCLNCGMKVDEPDTVRSYVGEFWGAPVYENVYRCPFCGDYDLKEFEEKTEDDEEDDDAGDDKDGETD